LQCLTNLDLLPPTGAIVIAAPLKIRDGSGSPLRAIALVPAPANAPARDRNRTSEAKKRGIMRKRR